MGKLFGTDGLRGAAGEYPLDNATLELLGRILYFFFIEKAIAPVLIVGRDTRASGTTIADALTRGFIRSGGHVHDGGVLPTPAIAYLAKTQNSLAVSITASHNPADDNGIKLFAPDGYKLQEQVESEIESYLTGEKMFLKETAAGPGESSIHHQHFATLYSNHLKELFSDLDLSDVRIVIDCANGALFEIAPAVLRSLGAEVAVLNVEPDGKNINYMCGSLFPEVLANAVRKTQFDCGFTFDGDGDRCLVADTNAMYDGDFILGAAARYLHSRSLLKQNAVVATTMSNLGLEVFLKTLGIELRRVPVGDKYVLEKLELEDLSLGGEQSGHVIFMNDSHIGDGLLTALQILRIYKNSGSSSFSAIWDGIRKFPQTLTNVPVKSKPDLQSVPGVPEKILDIEAALGLSGRIVVRYSGTEMLARIMIEGPEQSQIEEMAGELSKIISSQLC